MKREDWMQCGPIEVVIDGVNRMLAQPKLFSTGSRGWYLSGKLNLGDERVQVSLSLTVVGSKAEQAEQPATPKKDSTRQKRARIAQEPIAVENDPSGLWDGTGPLPNVQGP